MKLDEKEEEEKRIKHLRSIKEKITCLTGHYATFKALCKDYGRDKIPDMFDYESEFFLSLSEDELNAIGKYSDIELMNCERVEDIPETIYSLAMGLNKTMEMIKSKGQRFNHSWGDLSNIISTKR